MEIRSKIFGPQFKIFLAVSISVSGTIVVITAMWIFSEQLALAVQIITVGGAVIGIAISSILIWRWVSQIKYNQKLRELDLQIKLYEVRKARFLLVGRNQFALSIDDGRIIEGHYKEVKQPEAAVQPLRRLTDIQFVHILIVGGTNTGKTTVMNHLIDNFPLDAVIYVLDPHAKFNRWSNRANVIGEGYDFKAVADILNRILAEMEKRYKGDETEFQKIVVVADEWLAIANHEDCSNASTFFKKIGSEARKSNIHLILGSQSSTVKDLGIEGSGQARDNFVQLTLTERLKAQSLGKLKWGSGDSEDVELPGPYHLYGRFFNRSQTYMLPEPSEPEPTDEEQRIYELHLEGKSVTAIADAALSGHSQQNNAKVRKILKEKFNVIV